MSRRRSRRIGILLAALLVAVAGGAWLSLGLPFFNSGNEIFVRFDHGAGTVAMAKALREAGVIRYDWQFLLARALDPKAKLAAGEYRFDHAASVWEVYGRITRGDVYYLDLTIPEGSNIFDIARLAEATGTMSAQDFVDAARDASPIRDIDPGAPTLEGYLFPSTYRITHSTTASQLCSMMTAEFRRQWKKLLARAAAPQGAHPVVTLASLIEKETSLPDERRLIAGVFSNRLQTGMHLDCDPTTIYAALLDQRYKGVIHRSDLDSRNPYNTYQNAGLPPGPISNPGAGSLAAALHPAETEYLYFVAKPEGGGHQFSATLAQHDQAVQKYRRGIRQQAHHSLNAAPAESAHKAPKKT